MRPTPTIFLSLLLLGLAPVRAQDNSTRDISSVYAEGKVIGSEYRNNYFGLTLASAGGRFTKGGFINREGRRARLVDVENNVDNWQDKFEIAVLADSLAANPLVRTPEQYVRSVRHQFEKQGMETERAESPVDVSGLSFVRAVMKVRESGRVHYRAMYTTFLKGYILSLDVSAATPEKIDQLVAKAVKFQSERK